MRLRLLIAAGLALSATSAWAAGCLRYEPAVVHLAGRIVERSAYGPPGYGESPTTDSRESFLVLLLDRPICVIGSPGNELDSESERNVRELMMVPPLDGHRLPRGRAAVTGTLFHAVTAHHRTRVLITVTSAQAKASK